MTSKLHVEWYIMLQNQENSLKLRCKLCVCNDSKPMIIFESQKWIIQVVQGILMVKY